ncbi:hypothetical protein V6N12_013305 [Hibiscus sabdariffa]|uniref:Uncharacterized protein n=1 Tax=Hibiscus sabdariffa TaxID=183260 RepID=A0ABR2D646_9ROSI
MEASRSLGEKFACEQVGERTYPNYVSRSIIRGPIDLLLVFATSVDVASSSHRWRVSMLPLDVFISSWCCGKLLSGGASHACYLWLIFGPLVVG